MSTVFEVPCPECGRQMSVGGGGELQCPTCARTYTARMGHLFLVGEPTGSEAVSESPRGPAGRPTATTP